jgi:hypothetical protein
MGNRIEAFPEIKKVSALACWIDIAYHQMMNQYSLTNSQQQLNILLDIL